MGEAPDREAKTEQPTEQRLKDAKKKGNAPFSRDVPVVLNTVVIWIALSFLSAGAFLQIAIALRPFLERPAMWDIASSGDFNRLLSYLALYVAGSVLPIIALFGLSGLLGAIPQTGGIAGARLKPDVSRLSPAKGLKRILGPSNLMQGAKAVIRVVLLAAVAFWSLRRLSTTYLSGDGLAPMDLAAAMLMTLTALIRDVVLVIVVLAILDVFMVRYFWRRDLMMTKQEIKDEAKASEGDLALKHRMRLLARQRLKRRMMGAVPQATVVIVNPTHIAVALRYLKEEGGAPRVVAKGQDTLALRIRAIAEQNDVPVIEDKPLARALHEAVPVDSFIPPEFYKAVAQIISMLMKRKR